MDTVCCICNSILYGLLFAFFDINSNQCFVFKTEIFAGLSHRFQRHKKHVDHYEDIYDGSVYKKLMSPGGVLESMNNPPFFEMLMGFFI